MQRQDNKSVEVQNEKNCNSNKQEAGSRKQEASLPVPDVWS